MCYPPLRYVRSTLIVVYPDRRKTKIIQTEPHIDTEYAMAFGKKIGLMKYMKIFEEAYLVMLIQDGRTEILKNRWGDRGAVVDYWHAKNG